MKICFTFYGETSDGTFINETFEDVKSLNKYLKKKDCPEEIAEIVNAIDYVEEK